LNIVAKICYYTDHVMDDTKCSYHVITNYRVATNSWP